MLLQGLADVELWQTDARSRLLARNEGKPALLGRLHLWSAWDVRPNVTLYALGELEGGSAAGDTELALDQAGIRWTSSPTLVVDAGILTHPVGAFGGRRLSNRNPLIGAPDGYPVMYPVGVQLSGAAGMFDWRMAAVSLPVTNERYTPAPTARARPAFGMGITPAIGVRIGGSYTRGAYLNCDLPESLLAGGAWSDYAQRLAAIDVQASRGYLELWGEVAHGTYDVPGQPRATGTAAYIESRYTFSPRWYVAARAERNDYPYITPRGDSAWMTPMADVRNVEAGIGFRMSPSRLLKLSWRRDRWHVAPQQRATLPDGYAVAFQFSQGFELLPWPGSRR